MQELCIEIVEKKAENQIEIVFLNSEIFKINLLKFQFRFHPLLCPATLQF